MRPILYVDDEPDDIFFMVRACKRAGVEEPIESVSQGSEAIAYLSGTGKYADRLRYPMPRLILLDLNIPGVSGLDILKWIRSTPSVSRLPVLVLTSSSQESDVRLAQALGANGYLVKPGKIDELVRMIKAMRDYWLANDKFSSNRL
jgi:CheY-like chemotaxis protein